MKSPLSVYIAFDQSFCKGKEIFDSIYGLLCRDPKEPLSDGLDIPIYLRTNVDGVIADIPNTESEKTLVLVLADDFMFEHQDLWSHYIDHLKAKEKKNSFVIEGVKLSKFAFNINSKLSSTEFIERGDDYNLENWEGEFKIRILDLVLRVLLGDIKQKPKVFISHCKTEKDNLGEKKALEFKEYIQKQTKFDAFFDKTDILDGSSFEEQIDGGIEPNYCMLVILNTDKYSTREWCQHEVLVGKKAGTTLIVVDLMQHKIERMFPYMVNIPYVQESEGWETVLFELLREAVNRNYEKLFLEKMIDATGHKDDFVALSNMPEAYNFRDEQVRAKHVLYPEPPLAKDEINVLKEISSDDNKMFLTPMQLVSSEFGLVGKNVAISISEAPNALSFGYSDNQINDLTIELVRHILITGSRMVYGGDMRKYGYTRLFKQLAGQYADYIKSKETTHMFFTDYLAWPFYNNLSKEDELEFRKSRTLLDKRPKQEIAADIDDNHIDFGDVYTRYCVAESLSKMREDMEEHTDGRILVGGKSIGFLGKMAGLYEEFAQSITKGHPVYLIGGFGGAAAELVELVRGKKTADDLKQESLQDPKYKELMDYMTSKGQSDNYFALQPSYNNIDILRNGLSPDENKVLFKSQNIMEIVSLVLKGLKNKLT